MYQQYKTRNTPIFLYPPQCKLTNKTKTNFMKNHKSIKKGFCFDVENTLYELEMGT